MSALGVQGEIGFWEIRKGDSLVVKQMRDDALHTTQGVAYSNVRHTTDWQTSKAQHLVSMPGSGIETVITLMERPVPDEPQNVGALVRAKRHKDAAWRFYLLVNTNVNFPWVEVGGPLLTYTFAWENFVQDVWDVEVLFEGMVKDGETYRTAR